MLHDFILLNRDEIIRLCRAKVAARSVPPPALGEIDHGVPVFLEQLVDALRAGGTSGTAIGHSAHQHGHDLLKQGFTVSQVVHDYGDICQSITQLAVETNAPISTEDFRMLNGCLDDAIASAVTEYARVRNQATHDVGSERLGFFAHELGNLINTGIIAFEILKTGNVGVGGSTGAVLNRSLMGLRSLVTRSLAEIRLTEGIQKQEPLAIGGLIEELAPGTTLEAIARGTTFEIAAIDPTLAVSADRQILSAVVSNLLQNAFKFTAASSTVKLRVGGTADRVLIEVEDQCGGLPVGNVEDLFRPFEQRGADRTGSGLGLAFCRWAVEASNGRIHARSLPGHGCIFTVDLPRVAVPAAVPV